MIKIMSEEEAKQQEKDIDKFLTSLDFNTKSKLVSLLKPMQKQINCEHDWIDPNEYDNELDKTKQYCRHCDLTKDIYD